MSRKSILQLSLAIVGMLATNAPPLVTETAIAQPSPTPSARPSSRPRTPPSANTPRVYTPQTIALGREVRGVLSDRDIPNGEGGYARDYIVRLEANRKILIEVASDEFDTVVVFMNAEGKTIGKNDDGPDGSTDSTLFTSSKEAGTYTIRVQGFSGTSGGAFRLLARGVELRPACTTEPCP